MRQFIPRADPSWEVCGSAANGEQAVQQAIHLKPDLIILDVWMPAVDGISAARKIRAQLPDVPILMYTFLVVPHLEDMAKQAGAQAIVQKGDLRALIAEIRRVLAAKPTVGAALTSGADGAEALLNLTAEAAGGKKSATLKTTPKRLSRSTAGKNPPTSGKSSSD
jgi:two-component system chemotaxis response regulator CheB